MIQVKKALVVDDSRLARIALSKLLQRRNVDVDTVATGTEAINYLRTTRPDVVFMDYMMPDMDGFEATRRIRSLPGETDIPVVMYTAQENEEDRERAEALGIAGFLTKPSGEDSLEEILESLERLSGEPGAATVAAKPESPIGVDREQSAAAKLAPAPDPQAKPSPEGAWQDVRAIAIEATQQLVQQRIDSLRGELEEMIRQAIDAGHGSSDAQIEQTARRVAEDSARETVERFGKGMGPQAPEKIKTELRRELRGYMAELLAADVFRHQFTEIVLETTLPRLREEMIEETLPQIRDRILEDTRRLAREAARDMAANAARDATSEQIAVSLTEYRMQADDRIRQLVQASADRLRRSLYTSAGIGLMLIIAAVAASVYLSTHGVPF